MEVPIGLRGPTRLDEDVGAVVRHQVVPRVGREDARAVVRRAPVGAQVGDGARQPGPVEGAPRDGDRHAIAPGPPPDLVRVAERAVEGVEVGQAWRAWWCSGGGGSILGQGQPGEEGEAGPEEGGRGGCQVGEHDD